MTQLSSTLRKYGEEAVVLFTLVDATGGNLRTSAPTFAASDTQIIKDEGAIANTSNDPVYEGGGMFSLTITATEMQAARVGISMIDQTDPQTWLDEAIALDTYGNASAQHAFDLDTASTAQTGDSYARLGAPAGASVSADIAAIEAQTDDIGVAGAGLTDLGGMSTAMKAEVNAEVVDTLNVDTYAEPAQGAPTATTTLVDKIGFLYKGWRNKSDQTATTYQLYNDDASTVDHKATVSDDTVTTTKGEIITGP